MDSDDTTDSDSEPVPAVAEPAMAVVKSSPGTDRRSRRERRGCGKTREPVANVVKGRRAYFSKRSR